MGYTRYWNRTDKPYDEDFVNQVIAIIADCTSKGISLADGFGEGSPVANMDRIWLNGPETNDLGHETFFIPNTGCEHFETGFNFCKTARKPYDYAVRRILKIAEEQGIVNDVSDDGPNDEVQSDADYLLESKLYSLIWKFKRNDIDIEKSMQQYPNGYSDYSKEELKISQDIIKELDECYSNSETPTEFLEASKKIVEKDTLGTFKAVWEYELNKIMTELKLGPM